MEKIFVPGPGISKNKLGINGRRYRDQVLNAPTNTKDIPKRDGLDWGELIASIRKQGVNEQKLERALSHCDKNKRVAFRKFGKIPLVLQDLIGRRDPNGIEMKPKHKRKRRRSMRIQSIRYDESGNREL
jgi:hypothetical protein